MNGKELAEKLSQIILHKLGENILILDLRGVSPLTDFFVITTASSTVHARAIAESLLDRKETRGLRKPHHIEGMENAQWILLDYFDVIVHIFTPDVREFYGLERLWGDVPQRLVK
ncbi:MAG: ribosome silencing factor [candidate division WOR-3 bacterium]